MLPPRTGPSSCSRRACRELIFGSGQYGNAALSPEAGAFLNKKRKVIAKPTQGDQDLQSYARAQGRAVPREQLAKERLFLSVKIEPMAGRWRRDGLDG
jgi:hypothetical protein